MEAFEAMPEEDGRAEAMQHAAKQPNSRHCFVCGVENPAGLALTFYEQEPATVVAEYTVPEHFQGYPGIAHGGIVAAMLDEILGRTAMVGDQTHFMMTGRLTIRYRKPVPVAQRLRLVGRLTKRRERAAAAVAELWLPDGSLAAEAEATLVDHPDVAADPQQLEALGWRVYPDRRPGARGPMPSFEYHRPKTVEHALDLLQQGVPLAGGTVVTPRRAQVPGVIDLRDLGLDDVRMHNDTVELGAAAKLQSLVESQRELPAALISACRLEGGWNLRNMATVGGTMVVADGRSPFLTVWLALDSQVVLEPGTEVLSLEDFLMRRADLHGRQLVTWLRFRRPQALAYEQVSRAPADRPLVCAAASRYEAQAPGDGLQAAIGGFGAYPARLAVHGGEMEDAPGAAAEAAMRAFSGAEDEWASAAYRSEVAGVLVRRVLGEVLA